MFCREVFLIFIFTKFEWSNWCINHANYKRSLPFFCRTWPFIPLILCLNFNLKSNKTKRLLIIFITLIVFMSIVSTMKDFNLIIEYLPFFESFNPRFISLNIICWYIILTLSLSELLKQNIKYKILNSAFLFGL